MARFETQLDAENPNGNNGAEHNYSAHGPARDISRTIRFWSIDPGIVPMGHGASYRYCLLYVGRCLRLKVQRYLGRRYFARSVMVQTG
jgi:hypothetical protein